MLQNRQFKFSHARFLEDSGLEVEGISIYGSPWCPDLSSFAYYAAEQDLINKWREIPSGTDILVTHTPPYGVLDMPTSRELHLGCPHLRDELVRIRPRVHVYGHVHASHGQHTHDGTQFVNAAVVGGRNLEVRHGPTLVTLDAT